MKNILKTLAFYAEFPGWHTFNRTEKSTVNAIRSLEKRGFLEVSYINSQAKFIKK